MFIGCQFNELFIKTCDSAACQGFDRALSNGFVCRRIASQFFELLNRLGILENKRQPLCLFAD